MKGLAVLLGTAAALSGCGGPGAVSSSAPPAAGVMLLALSDGGYRGSRPLGTDPIAVTLAGDGRTAYVSDNAAGDVRALSVPELKVVWETHVGGRPGPLLVHGRSLLVSLFGAAEVVELAVADGSVLAHHAACMGPGQIVVTARGVMTGCAGQGFGAAWSGMAMWRADASGAVLRGDQRILLPPHMHPFWLEPDGSGGVVVAAEGDDEDTDPGGVFAIAPDGSVRLLLQARDPDQVALAGNRVLVAAHGEHAVIAATRSGTVTGRWARGAAPVGLAADAALGLLVVVTNARE